MNVPLAGKDRERWFARICEELRPDLFRFAFWLARDRQVAEDVVQESLLRAWRSRDSLETQDSARHWLLTIVRREHARRFERKRVKTVQVDELVNEESPELAVADEREVLDMRRAIMRLPDDYRPRRRSHPSSASRRAQCSRACSVRDRSCAASSGLVVPTTRIEDGRCTVN
jgi:RNA polymerase sigma factor (sigma-70 family)